jgi:hypothetical protein
LKGSQILPFYSAYFCKEKNEMVDLASVIIPELIVLGFLDFLLALPWAPWSSLKLG